MIDAPDILRDYLLTKTAITALVSTRIWAELTYPPTGYKPADGGAIVFKSATGGFVGANTIVRNRWQFKVYGPDVYAIGAVYRVLMDVMHDVRGSGIKSSGPEAPGTMLEEPDSGWAFMLVYFETRMKSGLPILT